MNSSPSLPAARFWQIFRKDLRLLWPLAAAGALVQALLQIVLFHSDPYPIGDELSALGALLLSGVLVSMVLLIVLAVQQDAPPSLTQDWLVRPIRRRDLLLAKLMTVVLLIHGPIVVAKLVQGLAEGFPLGQLLRAIVLSNFEIALVFSLPVMAIAALTTSVGEAVVTALAIFFGLIAARLLFLGILFPFTHSFHFFQPAAEAGVAWVWRYLSHSVLLVALVAVLLMQYFRRSTREAQAVFGAALLLFVLMPSLPWGPAFAIQQGLAAHPEAGRAVSIDFDPGARYAVNADASHLDSQVFREDSDAKKKGTVGFVQIVLPLQISGVPVGLLLHTDRSVVRLVRADGKTLYRGRGHVFDLRAPDGGAASAVLGQTIQIPAAIYQKAGGQSLRLEVDYSLTMLRSRTLPRLTAVDGQLRMPEVGQCASRIDADHSAIQVACREVGALPPCMSAALEQANGARRNPEKFDCDLDYEPRRLRFSSEPINIFAVRLPLRDPEGGAAAHFPLDETQLSTAQVVLRVYEPLAHFSRHLVIPQLRLQDWRAVPPAKTAESAATPPADP
jgi:hypothetical protein